MHTKINKSEGASASERFLINLCDKTFLKLWAYPNPFKCDQKELCDLLVVFENHVFIFFDRESRKFDNPAKDISVQWNRWEKEVIQKQLRTAAGAKHYILSNKDKIYLDQKNEILFPITIPDKDLVIHKIVVAHGAKEACEDFSEDNISGSLAISYGENASQTPAFPFMVHLDNNEPVHIFDSHNLEIILGELDTVFDFMSYLEAKEAAINKYDFLMYAGEEDLLAHYFSNFDKAKSKHYIGTKDKKINAMFIPEGEWEGFINSGPYMRRKEANKESYLWDNIIQKTSKFALDGELLGDSDVFHTKSPVHEMAKESRAFRRILSKAMAEAIRNFPEEASKTGMTRHLRFMLSQQENKGFVFLQLHAPEKKKNDGEYRSVRRNMLELACGATKNKFPELEKIIGIVIDAPKFS
jgi:hypothetical protein